jgi:cysteine-rich repeat protein
MHTKSSFDGRPIALAAMASALFGCSLFAGSSETGSSSSRSTGALLDLGIECASPCTRASTVGVRFAHFPGNVYDTIIVVPRDEPGIGPFRAYTNGAVDGVVTFDRLPSGVPLVARAYRDLDYTDKIAESAPFTVNGDPPRVTTRCSDDPCKQTSTVTVDFANLPGFTDDAVSVLPVGANAGEPWPYQLTGGHPDGTLTFTNLVPGDVAARAFRPAAFDAPLAVSAPFRVVGESPTLTLTCSEAPCRRTSLVTVRFAHLPGRFYDLVTFAPLGAPPDQHVEMRYTQGQISGEMTFTHLPRGRIVARAFDDYAINLFSKLLVESAYIDIVGDAPSVTIDPCPGGPCPAAGPVTVRFANMPGYSYDLLTFARKGSPLTEHAELLYTSAAIDGAVTVKNLPANVPLVVRAFQNQDWSSAIAVSDPVVFSGDPVRFTVGCAPTCLVGQDIDVTFSGMPGFAWDFFAPIPWGHADEELLARAYTSGRTSGTVSFGPLPVGAYVVKGFVNQGPDTIGASVPFTVGPVVPVCGDGIRAPATEECDDGNAADGDSCSTACGVTAVGAAPRSIPSEGPPAYARTLGDGRHPIAAGDLGFAVAFVEKDSTASIAMTPFTPLGVSRGARAISAGTSALPTSDPVLAALPGGRYAAAWTDLAGAQPGDGDALGVALRWVDPSGALGVVTHANVGTAFNQYSPDILFDGSEVVVAWVDESKLETKLDIRYRRFSPALAPLGGEEVLAVTADAESDVALAAFSGSWAAAWRVATDAGETIRVRAKQSNVEWTVGPFTPGPAGVKPALVALDDAHLLVVFVQGVDVDADGAIDTSTLSAAVLDRAAPGSAPFAEVAGTSGASRPSAAFVNGSVYLAWESRGHAGASAGKHVWLKEAPWGAALDWSRAEVPLPREASHRVGDQERGALCASPLVPTGAVIGAWIDEGESFGNVKGEVAVQLGSAPILRTP